MTSKYRSPEGHLVEVITLVREGARQCFKVTDRYGYHVKDCVTLDELAAIVGDLADLEPLD